MSEHQEIRVSLIDNSHAYLKEAVSYALVAQGDAHKWQFAILNLVQSLELGLKSLLHRIHPILVYENIDKLGGNMVGLEKALERLTNPLIAGLDFTDTERQRIKSAVRLRNSMMHGDFALRSGQAANSFFQLLRTVGIFLNRHFDCAIADIVPTANYDALMAIRRGMRELVEVACQRILDDRVDADMILRCPNCGHKTFVIQDFANTCYTCYYKSGVCECSYCKQFVFEWQMQDFSSELEIDYSESDARIAKNYGYEISDACHKCVTGIREDIARQRIEEEHFLDMESWHLEEGLQ